MNLSNGLLVYDDNGDVWRLIQIDLIAGGTVLATMWVFVLVEDTDPDDDSPPSGTIADEKIAEFDGRQWHEVVYYFCSHNEYPGGSHTHGMRCIVYEVVTTPQQITPADRQQEGGGASI